MRVRRNEPRWGAQIAAKPSHAREVAGWKFLSARTVSYQSSDEARGFRATRLLNPRSDPPEIIHIACEIVRAWFNFSEKDGLLIDPPRNTLIATCFGVL